MPVTNPSSACDTLIGCFRRNAETCTDKVGLIYLADGEKDRQSMTYGEWYGWSAAIADQLSRTCARGEPALLPMENSLDFLAGFMGGLLAGTPVVPLPSPTGRAGWRRFQAVAQDCAARTVITRSRDLDRARARADATDHRFNFQFVLTDEVARDGGHRSMAANSPDMPAFLQYTSGSTGEPKGVIVTHANLLHNERLICQAMGNHSDSVFLTWLPLFHDMGLICSALQSVYLGTTCYLMSPAAFIQRPLRWLEAVSRFGVTSTGAPNFAYDLCVDKAASLEPGALDLSRWELAFNGAEPVRGKTLRAFAEAFHPFGFRDAAFFPGYGMAEATLLVSGSRSAGGPQVSRFDGKALACGQALPSGAEDAVELVRCGNGLPGQEIRIVAPSTGASLPANHVGEIWIRGESVGAGYWNRPEATAATFCARLSDGDDDTYLRTGDLGFFHDDGLYVAGRVKDLIVIRGMNHYPQDIEYTVEASHPALLPHGSAAFSVARDDGDHLVVVAELSRAGLHVPSTDDVIAAVSRAIASEHELVADTVVLVRPGHLPKTTSGKVRRNACRDAWLNHQLNIVASAERRMPNADPASMPADSAPHTALAKEITRILNCRAGEIARDRPLTAYGMDSLAAMKLQERLQTRWGLQISLAQLLDGIDLASLLSKLESGPRASPGKREAGHADSRCADNQRSLWLHRQAWPDSAAYNVTAAFSLHGPVDERALAAAFASVAARHEALRSTFCERNGQIDLQLTPGAGGNLHHSRQSLAELAAMPFDLARGPLFRAFLIDAEQQHPVLALCAHHSVVDLWSIGLLMTDLGNHYRHLTGGADPPRPALFQYRSFIERQQNLLAGQRGQQLRDYWRNKCAGMPAPLQITGARRASDDDRADISARRLGRDRTDAIKTLAREMAVTPFTVLLSAFHMALMLRNPTAAGTLGVTTSGRDHPELREVVGYTVNVLPITLTFEPGTSFRSNVTRIQREILSVLEHSEYPLQLILEDPTLRIREKLFRIVFVWQHLAAESGLASSVMRQAGGEIRWGDLTLRSLQVPVAATPFDLTFSIIEDAGEFSLATEHRSSVYDAADIRQLCDLFTTVVDWAVTQPDLPADTACQRAAAIARPASGAAVTVAPAAFIPVHTAFESNARAHPQQTALVEGERRLTYGELNSEADRIAARLQRAGITAGAVTAICLPRSMDAVAAILGILKSGAAYVPVLPEWPEQRKSIVLDESTAVCVVTCRKLLSGLPKSFQNNAVVLDDDVPTISDLVPASTVPAVCPDQPAYILFTSGTTGRPKGVAITHANLASYVYWASECYLANANVPRGFALFTSLGFDLTVTSLFTPLVTGTHVILFPDESDESALIARVLRHPEVGLVKATPSHMRLVQALRPTAGSVHTLILGGESLSTSLARDLTARLGPRLRIFNEYGPTEATVGCICHLHDATSDIENEVPVGRPVAGARAYLLNGDLLPVAAGETGELFLAGPGVASGYQGRRTQTAASFVPEPHGDGTRMYRTGDLARVRPDGALMYLGRRDEQIKWRGVRIEPREIGQCLERYPGIRASVVALVTGPAGTDVLCAWYVADAAIPTASLSRFLADQLPDNMIPAFLTWIASLPLNVNGKVDRNALPTPRADTTAVGPRTPVEAAIYDVWCDILGLDDFGMTDRFTALGGDSISAMRVAAGLGERGLSVCVRDIFEHKTIEKLALVATPVVPELESPQSVDTDGQDLRPGPMAAWLLAQRLAHPQHYHQVATLLCPDGLEPNALRDALSAVRAHHAGLRLNMRPGGTAFWKNDAPVDDSLILTTVDVSDLSEPHAARQQAALVRQICATTDLESGALFRPLLFRMPEGSQLVIACHHLLVDSVSWRIIAEDLTRAWRAIVRGDRPRLSSSAGLHEWTRALERLEQSSQFADQVQYWEQAERGPRPTLTVSAPRRVHRETFHLTDFPLAAHVPSLNEGTRSDSGDGDRVAVETMLVAAAARALLQRFQVRQMLIEMEHHGRDVPGVDLSRTIGWLTSLYPLALSLPAADDTPEQWLASIDEQRRRVPDNGVGYGVVRQRRGSAIADPWAPAVLRINYLGAWRRVRQPDRFQLDPTRSSLSSAEQNAPSVLLEMNAYAIDERICVEAGFDEAAWNRVDRACFMTAFDASFRAMAAAAQPPTPTPVRSFEAAGLSEHELDILLA
ncbi:amino acid adenylation domain-containing protein [Bradyrhizobium ontarionense]|uniref:Amino acid adenylation domain-containing protein n=1 Tax=Bradyrhizobium ontarionense TaxID=2898149 RepID=A0ABY3RA65_9BRAD|nr:non-ribosomal peptide synthetase [Bradyrhizobium sp. A19]UFZ04101.1 amino acid adenylation domain-containing protein [Bradyrhizobium sp. A19]